MRVKIEEIVRRAGQILREAVKTGAAVHEKEGVGNFVTDADLAIQRFLQAEFRALLPEARFVGEEKGGDAYSETGLCFIVDPIDGTTNFIRALGGSVVSVGLIEDGVPKIGVVYEPLTDELFSAERGKGAFLNGRAIHVSDRPLNRAIVVFGATSYQRDLTERMFRTLRGLFDRCEDLRQYGSAALDICKVACGRLDAFMELRLYPWDYAGALCILTEAGGRIATAEGGPLSLGRPASVFAANAAAFDEGLAVCRACME